MMGQFITLRPVFIGFTRALPVDSKSMIAELSQRWILRPAVIGLGKLPLPVIQALGAMLGLAAWYGRSRMALVTRENLALCYPEMPRAARDGLARASMMETGKTGLEAAFAWTASFRRCRNAIVEVEGKELLDETLASGRGLILVIPHLGNWEMGNHFLGPNFQPTYIYQPNRSPVLDAIIRIWRGRTGTRLVETDKRGIKAQLEVLKSGGIICNMPDLEPDIYAGEFADFFGVPALTSTLVPKLARHTGASVMLAVCQRLPVGRGYRMVFSSIDDAELTVGGINAAIEAAITEVPEQYLWSYKRFNTRPPGSPACYQFRQHPLRVAVESAFINLWISLGRRLPLYQLRQVGALAGDLARIARTRFQRHTHTNLQLCGEALGMSDLQELEVASLRESGTTAMEVPLIWRAEPDFLSDVTRLSGLEYLYGGKVIVLTPPLGNRELLMRLLANRYPLTEAYLPRSNTALDDRVRRERAAMGIRLVPYSLDGFKVLKQRLAEDELVTICPDHQPGAGWGEFVPFFGQRAFMAGALACLIRETGAGVVIGAAVRDPEGFAVMLGHCAIDRDADDACLLGQINRELEQIIHSHASQYRWSDKRFQVRPPGEAKVYSRKHA